MAARREPSTIADLESFLTEGNGRHVPLMLVLDAGHQCVAGTQGADRDPYEWLKRFGPRAHHFHIQQSDASGDRHWPFNDATNRLGRIRGSRVLHALEASGADSVPLTLEVIPPFEQEDASVLADLRRSVEYWRGAIGARLAA